MKEYGIYNRHTRKLEYSYYYHRMKTFGEPYGNDANYVQFEVPEDKRAEQFHIVDGYVVENEAWQDVNPDPLDMKIDEAIRNAENFGNNMMLKFKRENVKLGATQLNVSGAILAIMSEKHITPSSVYPISLLDTFTSGTLTASVEVLNILIDKCNNGDYAGLETWINAERFTSYRDEVIAYLSK